MIGNLLQLKIAPSEIENMSYTKMKYYNSWYKVFAKQEAKILA
jgi:hypothetical protein